MEYLVTFGYRMPRGGARVLRQDVIEASSDDRAIDHAYAIRGPHDVLFVKPISQAARLG